MSERPAPAATLNALLETCGRLLAETGPHSNGSCGSSARLGVAPVRALDELAKVPPPAAGPTLAAQRTQRPSAQPGKVAVQRDTRKRPVRRNIRSAPGRNEGPRTGARFLLGLTGFVIMRS